MLNISQANRGDSLPGLCWESRYMVDGTNGSEFTKNPDALARSVVVRVSFDSRYKVGIRRKVSCRLSGIFAVNYFNGNTCIYKTYMRNASKILVVNTEHIAR